MMFEFIVLLVVIIVLFNKLNHKITDLNNDIAKLQDELGQYKDNLKKETSEQILTSEFDAQLPLLLENTLDASSKGMQPPPLPDTEVKDLREPQSIHLNVNQSKSSEFNDYKLDNHKSLPEPMEPDEQSLPIVTSLFHSIKNWFFGGNLVVRVGVIVLLVGVVLLLRLLSDYIEVSIESKLLAIGVIGLAIAGLGLKLAKNRFAYGITLQGTGLAIAYLTIFFAYSVYLVIPSLPSFIGLGVLSTVTVALAVRQNAFPLALLALSGGFFAPILTSTDTGSLTVLFSYYLLLNVTIAIIAHYRTWKVLNLFGVMVTFGLAYYWGMNEDLSVIIETQRWSLVLLTAIHVLLYLFVVIRYAQQIITYNTMTQTAQTRLANSSSNDTSIRSTSSLYLFPIDTGLLFSVPLLAFGLFSALLGDIAHALTMTSAILAIIYIGLGWLFIQRSHRYALITEGMLALGFGFLALVVPLALDAKWVAFGWSVQGLALVWFGRRSLRAWSVAFGLLLELISIGMLVMTLVFLDQAYEALTLSISAISYLASMFILRASNSPIVLDQTVAPPLDPSTTGKTTADANLALTARALGISTQEADQWLGTINKQSIAFSLVWRRPMLMRFLTLTAVIWSLYVLMFDIDQGFSDWSLVTTTVTALAALFSLITYWLINRYRAWHEIRQLSHGLLLLFYAMLVLQIPQQFEFGNFWTTLDWFIFAVLLVGWLIIGQLWLKRWHDDATSDSQGKAITQRSPYHDASWLGTGILVLTAAIHYYLPSSQGVITLLIPIAIMTSGLWLLKRLEPRLAPIYWYNWSDALIGCAAIFAPIALLWVIVTNWYYDGVIWDIPYVPLFNLYDVTLWLILVYSWSAYYISQKLETQNHLSATDNAHGHIISRPLLITVGLIGFWVISSMLVRALHAFIGTSLWNHEPMGAWQSEQVQTGLTILWTLIALFATIIASRRWHRTLWFMGIGLLGVVVLKLVLVDLSQTEAIWRVISFLGAGSLILLIGYLAPLPPEQTQNHTAS